MGAPGEGCSACVGAAFDVSPIATFFAYLRNLFVDTSRVRPGSRSLFCFAKKVTKKGDPGDAALRVPKKVVVKAGSA
jgi:hypothetical protein